MPKARIKEDAVFLGIEGGGTHTAAVLLDAEGRFLRRAESGPCNLRLNTDVEILRHFKQIKHDLNYKKHSQPMAIGAYVAGCRTSTDKARLMRLLKRVWPDSFYRTGNDTLSAFAAAHGENDGVILICGTGSIVRAQCGSKSISVGGWGHLGGDRGSGYWMGRSLIRAIFNDMDENQSLHPLGTSALAYLNLNSPEELVQWSLEASKDEIASLTRILFRYPQNATVRQILKEAVHLLVGDVALAIRRAGFRKSEHVSIAIHPGLAKHQPLFRRMLMEGLKHKLPKAHIFMSEMEGAVGAARLAAGLINNLPLQELKQLSPPPSVTPKRNLALALTEQRNPRTLDLDRRSIPSLINTMLSEESRTIPSIRSQSKPIAKAIQWIVDSFERGGRLFYVGAGTSGRLGILDATECPPTFGSDPGMVQGIIAGGSKALFQAVEAAEDNAGDGKRAVRARGIQRRDIVIGIAASGSTPFVLGALEEAHRLKAKTVLLTFNPNSIFQIRHPNFIKIAVPTGPEVITGSTRLKAGSATKMILNMFTTISMIRLGKVKSNLMVDLDPTCEKLHDRAARIYSTLKKISYSEAWNRLEQSGWNLKSLLGN